MRLVYDATGEEVKVGDVVKLDDHEWRVEHFREPHKPSSSGKIHIRVLNDVSDYGHEYYVGVIGATWIEREDRL